jgi:hypothetical protein
MGPLGLSSTMRLKDAGYVRLWQRFLKESGLALGFDNNDGWETERLALKMRSLCFVASEA